MGIAAHRVVISAFSAAEVMNIKLAELLGLALDQVRIRQTAVGFNFINVYPRRGIYF